MKTRDYKNLRNGLWYHIYNRGNNKELTFLDDQDFLNFLQRLRTILGLTTPSNIGKRGALRIKAFMPDTFTIAAYCLMPNHFHFLIRQNTDIGIGNLVNKLSTSYAKYFNKKYERVGNLFQDTYKAKLVGNDSYFIHLSAYIHNNPTNPLEYPYSSISEYLTTSKDICNTSILLAYFNNNPNLYKDFVLGHAEIDITQIKHLTFEE